jgi:hypothetical protein
LESIASTLLIDGRDLLESIVTVGDVLESIASLND